MSYRAFQNALTVIVSSTTGETEHDLVRRCVQGDAVAWRALYDRHFPEVERLVAVLGIADAGDDLCQEIFLLIYRHLARFRGEARLAPLDLPAGHARGHPLRQEAALARSWPSCSRGRARP